MQERKDAITMKGDPLTLMGPEQKTGDNAPGFTVLDNGLSECSFSPGSAGETVLLSVPSPDTDVFCDTEVRKFNQEIANLARMLRPGRSAWTCRLPRAGGAVLRVWRVLRRSPIIATRISE